MFFIIYFNIIYLWFVFRVYRFKVVSWGYYFWREEEEWYVEMMCDNDGDLGVGKLGLGDWEWRLGEVGDGWKR